jgi:hypothetical protein
MPAHLNLCLNQASTGQKKMFNKINLGILLAFLLIVLTLPVFGQQQMEDYLYQYDKYRESHDDFTVAKDKYIQYKTLQAKDESIAATKALILQRYQVLRAYFLALKSKLNATPSVVGLEYRAELLSRLDREINWFENQAQEVSQVKNPSLDDLFILSDRLEDKEEDLKSISYQILSTVLLGKLRNLYAESVVIKDNLAFQINSADDATRAAEMEYWLREVENKNYFVQKEIETAEGIQIVLKAKTREQQMVKEYQELKKVLENAKKYLNEAFSFEKEIYKLLTEAVKAKPEQGTASAELN